MDKRRVALVAGGMDELGTAICRRLYGAGLMVATTFSADQRAPEAWLAAQRDEGFRFTAFGLDLGDYADCASVVQKLLLQEGRLDVLVNNTCIRRDATLATMSLAAWREVMRVDLDSVFNLSKQVLAPMCAQRWGRIINISSADAQRGACGLANDAAAKAAMHGFTQALARELARDGITVNTISPGYLRAGMVTQLAPALIEKTILPQIPLGRLGEADEVAALLAYLASEQAGFITGANLAINGGQHMS